MRKMYDYPCITIYKDEVNKTFECGPWYMCDEYRQSKEVFWDQFRERFVKFGQKSCVATWNSAFLTRKSEACSPVLHPAKDTLKTFLFRTACE